MLFFITSCSVFEYDNFDDVLLLHITKGGFHDTTFSCYNLKAVNYQNNLNNLQTFISGKWEMVNDTSRL